MTKENNIYSLLKAKFLIEDDALKTWKFIIFLFSLAMLMIYFGVFLPIGLAFRALGRDALQRDFDYNRRSYWEVKKQPRDIASYYRQS